MDKMYRVFISSTYKDLIEERKAVLQILLEMDCFPAGMELFQASNDSQWNLIKKVIDSCDYYIIIIAGRYGSIYNKTNKSYTQMEYEYALKSGIPILCFIHKDITSLPVNKVDNIKKVKNFIELASSNRNVQYWANTQELAGQVSVAMHKVINDNPRLGWVRNLEENPDNRIQRIVHKILDERFIPISPSAYNSLEATKEDIKLSNEEKGLKGKEENGISNNRNLQYDDIKYFSVLHMGRKMESTLKEMTNIILSGGITALSNFFDFRLDACLPSFCFYKDLNELDMTSKNGVKFIFFDFCSRGITGTIVLELRKNFIKKIYSKYQKELNFKFNSKQEEKVYIDSMCSELGSIFTNTSMTVLSAIISYTITVKETSLRKIRRRFEDSSPIYMGKLSFMSNDSNFNSYLLLNVESIKTILFPQRGGQILFSQDKHDIPFA